MAPDGLGTNKYHFLIAPSVYSSLIVLCVWAIPIYVPHQMLASVFGFIWLISLAIMAIGSWHEDYISTRQLEQFPEPAEVIWEICKKNKTSYVVYLRSFNFERWQNPFPALSFIKGKNFNGSARRIEIRLVKALNGRLPVLALSDPSDPFAMPGAHRFGSLPLPWLIFIEEFLQNSSLIVFYIAEYNPGLELEVNLVRELGLTDKAIVVIGRTNTNNSESFSDFKWVLDENAPDFENKVIETVRAFDSAGGERFSGNPASTKNSVSGLSKASRDNERRKLKLQNRAKINSPTKRAVQVFIFLLPLILAFKMWGVPDILLQEYWQYDKTVIERRKETDELNKKLNNTKKPQPSKRLFE